MWGDHGECHLRIGPLSRKASPMATRELSRPDRPVPFAALLRQHRLDLSLTQAVLAERAGRSARAIQHLEAGLGQPYRAAQLWDAASGRPLARLEQSAGLYAVAFSPDASRLATASMDGYAHVWDLATGSDLVLRTNARVVDRFSPGGGNEFAESLTQALAFSSDGSAGHGPNVGQHGVGVERADRRGGSAPGARRSGAGS